MKMKFSEIEVGIEEIFFYNPNKKVTNICSMCNRENCPVDCKDIVTNCNSYEYAGTKQDSIATDWRIIQGMTVTNNNFAYLHNCVS